MVLSLGLCSRNLLGMMQNGGMGKRLFIASDLRCVCTFASIAIVVLG